MSDIEAVRILQNPLGDPAPPGHPGDLVKVSDGNRTIYLEPHEYASASPQHLRWLLAGGR